MEMVHGPVDSGLEAGPRPPWTKRRGTPLPSNLDRWIKSNAQGGGRRWRLTAADGGAPLAGDRQNGGGHLVF